MTRLDYWHRLEGLGYQDKLHRRDACAIKEKNAGLKPGRRLFAIHRPEARATITFR